MTRVSNDLRDSMHHKIMAGLPVINYGKLIHAVVQEEVIKAAPPEVQVMYADEKLRRYLNEVSLDVKHGNKYVQLSHRNAVTRDYEYYNTVFGLTGRLTVQVMDDTARAVEGSLYRNVLKRLKETQLVDKYFAQVDLRDSVSKRLRTNLKAATTFKKLYEILEPELHHYIPKDEVVAQLPACVAPVVDDLRKLGAVLPDTPKAAS